MWVWSRTVRLSNSTEFYRGSEERGDNIANDKLHNKINIHNNKRYTVLFLMKAAKNFKVLVCNHTDIQ